jgi:16S rRNA (guanine527-N7)-methyltransferase
VVVKRDSSHLRESFKQIGVDLTDQQVHQFEVYHAELLAWNPRASLISTNDEARVVVRHFLESAALLKLGYFDPFVSVLDLGSGGGFPGVPIKILRPNLRLVLLDSRRVKTLFLTELVQKLELENVSVVCERAENLKTHEEFVGKFEIVLCRAVAELAKIFQWSRPFLKPKGILVTIKGSKLDPELRIFRTKFSSAFLSIQDFPSSSEGRHGNQKVVCVSNEPFGKTD